MLRYRRLWLPILLLPSILACRAATRLISGIAPDSSSGSATATASLPVMGVPSAGEAACPSETDSILRAAGSESPVWSAFPGVDPKADLYILLVTYSVGGDSLSDPVLQDVPASLRTYQRDVAMQRSAWDLFTRLIPLERRAMVHQFQIMTDGPGGVLSAVEQTLDDPRTWMLEVDVADVPDTRNLVFTLLHEFGHLLTLSPDQVPPDLQIFNDPLSPRLYRRALAACPNYFPGEGCSLPDSYVNGFFGRFWPHIYDEWSAIDTIQDDDRRDARLDRFYRKYSDRFVDSYAATSPAEDIAETWAFYVLSPRPAGDSIADQKLSFFSDYPELVSLRGQILANLCAAPP